MTNESKFSRFINFVKNAFTGEEEDDYYKENPELIKYNFGNIMICHVSQ